MSRERPSVADRTDYAMPPDEAYARLETAVEYLRREWREGCRAGNSYQTALGSVRRLRQVAANAQFSAELATLIENLESYRRLPVGHRRAALAAISDAIKRLVPLVSIRASLVQSPSTFQNEPRPVAVQEDRPEPRAVSRTLEERATVRAGLYGLSPLEFEMTVAWLLQTGGFTNVQVIGGANDLGVDIRCYDESGNLVVVQCKRFAPHRRVTSPMIQHFMAIALHHGAHGKIFVTTSDYTSQAIALALDAGVKLIDGEELAALVDSSQAVARCPDLNVPVVLPDFYSDRPEHAATEARHAWLTQLLPETPVISGYAQWALTTTEAEKRAWHHVHERLLALTPEQFRKASILSLVASWERDRPAIRLLENENPSIKDYVLMSRSQDSQPFISRCHHLPAEHAVAADQLEQFMRFAKANGWSTGPYSTTGLFSAGALLRAHHHDFEGATVDGWHEAFWLIPDIHLHTKGNDFVGLAQQPGWPKLAKVLEGTERRGLVRRFFG